LPPTWLARELPARPAEALAGPPAGIETGAWQPSFPGARHGRLGRRAVDRAERSDLHQSGRPPAGAVAEVPARHRRPGARSAVALDLWWPGVAAHRRDGDGRQRGAR